jgi:hypothetical protein
MSVEAAIVSAIGSIIGNKQKASAANAKMAFQERMSNTAYQRAMADMRKAGINPMFAMKAGGASVPDGAMYNPDNVGAAAVEGYSKGNSAKLAQAQADGAEANVDLIKAQTAKTQAEAENTAGIDRDIKTQTLENLVKQNLLTTNQADFVANQSKKILQDIKQSADVHKERWAMKFATMSAENVMATILASLSGISVEKSLKNVPHTKQEKIALERFVRMFGATNSQKWRNAQGYDEVISQIGRSITSDIKGFENYMKKAWSNSQ